MIAANRGDDHRSTWRFAVVLTTVAFAMALGIYTLGHFHMGGYDHGSMIDPAYRIAQGQTPYVNFPITQPILFYLGGAAGVLVFGNNWTSFMLLTTAAAVGSFLLQTWLLRRAGVAPFAALGLAAGAQIAVLSCTCVRVTSATLSSSMRL